MPDLERNARAYLVLIVDTRQPDAEAPGDYRKLSAGIFSDAAPSTSDLNANFPITITSASGPSYQWCRDKLMELVDAPTSGLHWLQPLMSRRWPIR